MSESVLNDQQMASLDRQLTERLKQITESEPGTPRPPRPCCPTCGTESERIAWGEPEHGTGGITVRMQFLPCGHRFRGTPARPGEETT